MKILIENDLNTQAVLAMRGSGLLGCIYGIDKFIILKKHQYLFEISLKSKNVYLLFLHRFSLFQG